VSLEEVEEAYQDFEPDAKRLLNVIFLGRVIYAVTDGYFSQCFEKPSRWALHVVNELPLFACDRVALIGDAVGFSLLPRRFFDEFVCIGPCYDTLFWRWSWSGNRGMKCSFSGPCKLISLYEGCFCAWSSSFTPTHNIE